VRSTIDTGIPTRAAARQEIQRIMADVQQESHNQRPLGPKSAVEILPVKCAARQREQRGAGAAKWSHIMGKITRRRTRKHTKRFVFPRTWQPVKLGMWFLRSSLCAHLRSEAMCSLFRRMEVSRIPVLLVRKIVLYIGIIHALFLITI
jgi:hypothetical protein